MYIHIIVINNIVSYLNAIYLVSSRGICPASVEKTTQPLRSVRRKNFNSRYTSNCRFSMRERHFVLRKVIVFFFFLNTSEKSYVSIKYVWAAQRFEYQGKKRSKHYLCLFAKRKKIIIKKYKSLEGARNGG